MDMNPTGLCRQEGYSGTAIFTRRKPINVTYGIGIDEHDHEGRVITLETEDFFLVDVYTPNSQDGLKRLDYRMKWEDDFRAYLMRLDGSKPVIVCGDMNVAHQEIDLKNPKSNRRNAGFTDEERQKFSQLLASGFTDTFRLLHPEQVTYSWWSYRFKARERTQGAHRLLRYLATPRQPCQGGRHTQRDIRKRPLPC